MVHAKSTKSAKEVGWEMLVEEKAEGNAGLRKTKGKMACPGRWKAGRVTQQDVESR